MTTTNEYRGYNVSVRVHVGSKEFGYPEYQYLGKNGQPTNSKWDSDLAFFATEQAASEFAQQHGHGSWNVTGIHN